MARGRPKQYSEERVVMAVRLPKPLYKRLHHEAIDRETTVTRIVEGALRDHLDHPGGHERAVVDNQPLLRVRDTKNVNEPVRRVRGAHRLETAGTSFKCLG